jgi:hypothetical protein
MPMKHNKTTAKRFLKLIASTRKEDVQCSFACGQYGDTRVVAISRRKPTTVRSQLENMPWEGPEVEKKGKRPLEVKHLAFGIAKLEGTNLIIRCKKPMGAEGLAKAFRIYFKTNFKLVPLWGKVISKHMSDAAEENFAALPDDENLELISDEELERLQAETAHIEEDEAVDDWEDAFQPEDGSAEEKDNDHDATAGPQSNLPAPLREQIRGEVQKVAENALRVADSIGLPRRAELGDLVAKLAGWLERMLAATPADQREAVLYNTLARLTLDLAKVEALRDIQYVEKRSKAPAAENKEKRGEHDSKKENEILNGRINLSELRKDKLDPDEVVDVLFRYGVSEVTRRNLPYDVARATFQKIDKIVRSSWPKTTGAELVLAIDRLQKVIHAAFADDGRLINYLSLEKHKKDLATTPATGDGSIIPPVISEWKVVHSQARSQVHEIMEAAEATVRTWDPMMTIKKLGGSWAQVDNIFIQVAEEELERELLAIMGKVGDERAKAIEQAEATVEANLDWLNGNNIVALLDEPPFEGVPSGQVGAVLRNGLKGVAAVLSQLKVAA